MRKVFTSYHHANDQFYKEVFCQLGTDFGIFEDISVAVGDIDEALNSQVIRRKIRDEYLIDSEVTVLLCGTETKFRKHVDWEIKSSMIDGVKNKKSGILVIDLPSSRNTCIWAGLPHEKDYIYGGMRGWTHLSPKHSNDFGFKDLPERIVNNLGRPNVYMSVVAWDTIAYNPDALKFYIESTARAASYNDYCLKPEMRRSNYNPLADMFRPNILAHFSQTNLL